MAVEHIDLTLLESSDSSSDAEFNAQPSPSAGSRPLLTLETDTSHRPSPTSTHLTDSRGPISPPSRRIPSYNSSSFYIKEAGLDETYYATIPSPSLPSARLNVPTPGSALEPVLEPPPVSTPIPALVNAVPNNDHDMGGLSSGSLATSASLKSPPPSHPRGIKQDNTTTPKSQTTINLDWDMTKLVDSLAVFRQDVKNSHSQLAAFIIDSVEIPERRILSGTDLFANTSNKPVSEDKAKTMRVKFKQHMRTKKDHREEHHSVVCIKSNEERAPPFRNHHVEIKKNVLTRGTMLTFVPHLRDLESSEESKYNLWLNELEEIDRKSGFKPMNREDKVLHTVRSEITATISLYLEEWLKALSIPGCNKSALIRYALSHETAMTPKQKTDILKSHHEADGFGSSEANKAARLFTEAFHRVFSQEMPPLKRVELRAVLMLDESVDSVMDSRPTAKDGSSQNDNEGGISHYLGTYCNLGCNICFSHSCDHGEYGINNVKLAFSAASRLPDTLRRRRAAHIGSNGILNGDAPTGCRRRCYLSPMNPMEVNDVKARLWSNDERMVLRSVFSTADHSKVKKDPMCLVADLLDRECCDVFGEFERLAIQLPQVEPPRKPQVRNLSWYDRFKKCLIGDWQDHTLSHEHQRRDTPEPCSHDGPCTQENCICVKNGLLCEKFCGCTAECCAYKFTGCACHSQGKTCLAKQKDRPCICYQLNRECDPDVCGSCGALERADPENAANELLHSTGCQNCVLQRGLPKALALGQSQLEGCGYGLYTAVDIAQDDFVIEYVGELITHDEGVRREARRGDVFGDGSSVSYVFTLLDNEGIWVDAAVYGNLSRYINHAEEGEARGCNITPRIFYVNGEYRIKFTAIRNIEAWEELFFNYGENFPNLTKKLLDKKEGKPVGKKRGRRPHQAETGGVARKAPKADKKKQVKSKNLRKESQPEPRDDDIAVEDWALAEASRKRKRGRDDSEEEDYQPTGTDATGSRAETPETIDSDEPVTASLERLRKRIRRPRVEAAEALGKPRGLPKTRGKRGGARPGSGRPRKHPRPAPKPIAEVEEPITPTPAPPPAVVTALNQQRAAPKDFEEEVGDSDDGRHYLAAEHDEDDEDDDEDQDVVIRKRADRATRNRRPPAKFRSEHVWPFPSQ